MPVYNDFIDPESLRGFLYEGSPIIRSGTIIYPNVKVGEDFVTGHYAVIRSGAVIGSKVLIGTNVVIDGDVTIGDYVKIETGCYLPPGVRIGNRIFLGPNVTFTNDPMPLKRRDEYKPSETIVENNVSIGAGAVILPGVVIGENSFVAAGAVVTKSVPRSSLVLGHGEIRELPEGLVGLNDAKSWRKS